MGYGWILCLVKWNNFFLGPWLLVYRFIEISNQIELNAEVWNFGYFIENDLYCNSQNGRFAPFCSYYNVMLYKVINTFLSFAGVRRASARLVEFMEYNGASWSDTELHRLSNSLTDSSKPKNVWKFVSYVVKNTFFPFAGVRSARAQVLRAYVHMGA